MRTNHQTTAFQKPLFLHDSSVAVAPSPRCTLTPLTLRSGRITGGYTAPDLAGLPPKCSASPRTSHTRQPLYELASDPLGVKMKICVFNVFSTQFSGNYSEILPTSPSHAFRRSKGNSPFTAPPIPIPMALSAPWINDQESRCPCRDLISGCSYPSFTTMGEILRIE